MKLYPLPSLPTHLAHRYVLPGEKDGTTCPPLAFKLIILLRSLLTWDDTVFHKTERYNGITVRTILYLHGYDSEDRWDDPANLKEIASVTSSPHSDRIELVYAPNVFSGHVQQGINAWYGLQRLLIEAVNSLMSHSGLEFVKTQDLEYDVEMYDLKLVDGYKRSRTLALLEVQNRFAITDIELFEL